MGHRRRKIQSTTHEAENTATSRDAANPSDDATAYNLEDKEIVAVLEARNKWDYKAIQLSLNRRPYSASTSSHTRSQRRFMMN